MEEGTQKGRQLSNVLSDVLILFTDIFHQIFVIGVQGPKKKKTCQQWPPLKDVLLKLGVQEPDPHMGGSITWSLGQMLRGVLKLRGKTAISS